MHIDDVAVAVLGHGAWSWACIDGTMEYTQRLLTRALHFLFVYLYFNQHQLDLLFLFHFSFLFSGLESYSIKHLYLMASL